MTMTVDEIVADYRAAKNRIKQIGILADQACCSKQEIVRVLQDQGLDVPKNFLGKKAKKTKAEQPKAAPVGMPTDIPTDIPSDDKRYTEVRLGKVRLGKDKEEKKDATELDVLRELLHALDDEKLEPEAEWRIICRVGRRLLNG